MGVRGRRIVSNVDEPTLLGNIDDIIKNAFKDGFINDNKVDIFSIVRKLGIEIREEILPSTTSGFLAYIDGSWVIGVNKNHSPRRKRFTIAHEFAHYCLHKDEKNYFVDAVFFRDENPTSIEYAANSFAAKLLMPEDFIIDSLKKGILSLVELADSFDVSILAVKSRIIALGYKLEDDEE
jgi:Zn-dependent peptidase ImmA (M78 family)